MTELERRLCFSGLALFVLGLALGFVLRVFPNPRAALSAHLNAVQSGTFLMVLGLLWPKLTVWRGAATPLAHLIWIAFWMLEVGMVLAAFGPAAGSGAVAPAPLKLAVLATQGLSAVAMLVALAALLFTFRPAPR
jgi:hydroxylaminobenzene mutase